MPLFKADKKPSRGPAGRWDVVISEDMCKACGFCLAVCPVDVFAWRKTPNRLGWFAMYTAKPKSGPAIKTTITITATVSRGPRAFLPAGCCGGA